MIWGVCILIGLFIIGIALCLTYTICDFDDSVLFIGGELIITSVIVLVVLIAINNTIQEKESTSLEYPASEYTLSYKVIEFEGQRDTTYVLMHRDN